MIFFLIFIIGAAVVNKDLEDISSWWSVTATAVNIFTIIFLIIAARQNGMTYPQLINYEKGKTKLRQIIIISLIIISLGTSCMFAAGFICYGVIPYAAPMMIEPIPKYLAIINLPLLPITTALAEDGLYFGCGVSRIKIRRLR